MMIAMRDKHNMKTLRHFKIKKRLLFEFAMYEHWLAYELITDIFETNIPHSTIKWR